MPPFASRYNHPRLPQPTRKRRKPANPPAAALGFASPPTPGGAVAAAPPPAAMVVQERRTIDLEEGWAFIQKGITKMKYIIEFEGKPKPQFSSDEYMMLYTTIHYMTTQKPPHDYSQQLYDKYRETFEEYITSTVLPSLREKREEPMLRELAQRWSNHKIMVRWLSRFLHYLDRYFISRKSLTPLKEVGLTCFRELIYQEIKGQVKDAVMALIDKEREGEHIDRALLKNVLDIFVEIGLGQMECYENDFEDFLLKDTTEYYSVKAQSWIPYSGPDYMIEVGECLKREKERVGHYLHNSSEQKLLEKVLNELLATYGATLLKKEPSGCSALLHDEKVEDLSRTDQLPPVITNGLEPISASNELRFSSDDHIMINMSDDYSKHLCDKILKSVLERITHMVPSERAWQRVCEGITGSVVLVMFAPKNKSAFKKYRVSLIRESASLDVKTQEEKIQEILQEERFTTGFVVGENPTSMFILTCAHSLEQVFNKYHPIEKETIEKLYEISVTCGHLEHEHRLEKNSKCKNRDFVPAQVMGVDCPKDMLLIRVQKGICRETYHKPLELAQNLPGPLEPVGMVSWPYPRHDTVCIGRMSHQERDYSEFWDDDDYGYNFTGLEVIISCQQGSSGAPLVDLSGKVIGLLHCGTTDCFNYFVSLKDIREFLTRCLKNDF